MSRNFAKTLVWKHANVVKLWRHKQRTPNTNDHHMTTAQLPCVTLRPFNCDKQERIKTCLLKNSWLCRKKNLWSGIFGEWKQGLDRAREKHSFNTWNETKIWRNGKTYRLVDADNQEKLIPLLHKVRYIAQMECFGAAVVWTNNQNKCEIEPNCPFVCHCLERTRQICFEQICFLFLMAYRNK